MVRVHARRVTPVNRLSSRRIEQHDNRRRQSEREGSSVLRNFCKGDDLLATGREAPFLQGVRVRGQRAESTRARLLPPVVVALYRRGRTGQRRVQMTVNHPPNGCGGSTPSVLTSTVREKTT